MAAERETIESGLDAALHRAAVYDRSYFGRVEITGKDGLDLLHRLSTNDLLTGKPGRLVGTVFTDEKGRVIDFVRVAVLESRVIAITSPAQVTSFIDWVNKYCIMEEVNLRDISSITATISLIGPDSGALLTRAFGVDLPPACCVELDGPGGPMIFLRDNSFHADITDIIINSGGAQTILGILDSHAERIGADAYEAFRIVSGIPSYGRELSKAFNPYEAGLRHAISFTKGCYLGQEIVARLDTYHKVQRELIGLVCRDNAATVVPRPLLLRNSKEIGWRTSISEYPIRGWYPGLGIVKRNNVKPGDRLSIVAASRVSEAIVQSIPIVLDATHEA